MLVTRREHFSASHRLFNPEWTDERNQEVFGKCANPSGHGHNYVLEVTVAGEVDPVTGYVIDLKVLKEIIRREVIEKVDHKNLNVDVDFLNGVNPTAENIAKTIWVRLEKNISSGRLHSVRIQETQNNVVEYRGSNG